MWRQETLPASQRCSCLRRRAASAETVELPPPMGLVRSTSGTDPSGAGRRGVEMEVWKLMSAPTRFVPDEGESSVGTAPKGKCYPVELIQWTTAAQNQLLILLVSYEKSAGGFEFGPRDIGFLQNIGAVGLLSSQLFLYPKLTKKFGPLAGEGLLWQTWSMWRFVPLGCMQFMYTASTGMMFPTAFAFINRALEAEHDGVLEGYKPMENVSFFLFNVGAAEGLNRGAVKLGWFASRDPDPLLVACSLPGLRVINARSAINARARSPAAVAPAPAPSRPVALVPTSLEED
eukprot:s254_g44.t1